MVGVWECRVLGGDRDLERWWRDFGDLEIFRDWYVDVERDGVRDVER